MNFKFNAASFPDQGKAVRGLKRSFFRTSVTASMICFHLLAVTQPYAASVKWTAGSGANFTWADGGNWDLGVPTGLDDVLFQTPIPNPGSLLADPSVISLASGSFVANSLSFLENYSLSGGSLQLTTGSIRVGLAHEVTLNSLIDGNSGLTLIGGGTVRLSSASNSYTGATTLSNGTLIITDTDQLGSDSSAIVISVNNPVAGSVSTRGYGGGSLMLDGSGADITLTRDLSLQGQGPIGDRGAAVLSFGNNTLTGAINAAVPNSGTVGINTRLTSANGTLTLSGSLNVNGTAG
ncbi:MAG: hypothetical protein OJI67_10140, partial [Prosthecobacter sp.]|nr:hypothetical protein [Prosthecobacter sp.]